VKFHDDGKRKRRKDQERGENEGRHKQRKKAEFGKNEAKKDNQASKEKNGMTEIYKSAEVIEESDEGNKSLQDTRENTLGVSVTEDIGMVQAGKLDARNQFMCRTTEELFASVRDFESQTNSSFAMVNGTDLSTAG
jgi:hypothetical protein